MINIESFNTRIDGKRVALCTLTNRNGLQAQITNYGAKVVSLIVPNKQGEKADVVLGFSTFEEWRNQETYFNAIIGRYANRIKDGKFAIDGVGYQNCQSTMGLILCMVAYMVSMKRCGIL